MNSPWQNYIVGFRESLPAVLSAAPFGLLFGALAIDNGLTPGEALLMSAAVFGGASQMVGIQLFSSNAAAWLIVFSIFAVNFRHILYSASIGRHLGDFTPMQKVLAFFLLVDPIYAASEFRIENRQKIRFSWYLGMGSSMYIFWTVMTGIGALFGSLIRNPEAVGIDFLFPIYFLGLLLGFRKRPNWMPVVIASGLGSIVAYQTVGSPWHVSIGALAGILAAVLLPLQNDPQTDPVPLSGGPEDMG